MLQQLIIKNFALAEEINIIFQPGFNVITGETGAGKSILLQAITFLLGERADQSLLRDGSSSATCEAIFDLDKKSHAYKILDEVAIHYDLLEPLVVKRELYDTGKSRLLINNQNATLHVIKLLTPFLIEFAGEHAHLQLLSDKKPLLVVDAAAKLDTLKEQFQKAFSHEQELHHELEKLIALGSNKESRIQTLQTDITELEKGHIKDHEEESLHTELGILSHQEELQSKLHDILSGIDKNQGQLAKMNHHFDKLLAIDPTLNSTHELYSSAICELQEVHFTLTRYQEKLECNPKRLEQVEQRLREIERLKKKYGVTAEARASFLEKLKSEKHTLEQLELRQEELEKNLTATKATTNELASKLTKERIQIAKELSDAVSQELHSLNMPRAHFEVEIRAKHRGFEGDDIVEFFLKPNSGEKRIQVKDGASGGELARLSLALQVVLTEHSKRVTLLFDEIDSNIGGETATVVGSKLKTLGKTNQVIAITHFAQVALHADTHHVISKFEKAGRTVSTVQHLETTEAKQREITRMLGGKAFDKVLQSVSS